MIIASMLIEFTIGRLDTFEKKRVWWIKDKPVYRTYKIKQLFDCWAIICECTSG